MLKRLRRLAGRDLQAEKAFVSAPPTCGSLRQQARRLNDLLGKAFSPAFFVWTKNVCTSAAMLLCAADGLAVCPCTHPKIAYSATSSAGHGIRWTTRPLESDYRPLL